MTQSKVVGIQKKEVVGQELFPFPLVPMETFMVWDDLPDYPKSFRVGLVFQGSLDPSLFEESLRRSLVRHPLLCARLGQSGSGYYWFIPEEIEFEVIEASGGFTRSPYHASIQIDRSPPVRFWFDRSGGKTELTLEIHHAACDGIGCRKFLHDLFLVYDQLHAGKAVRMLDVTPQLLLQRGTFKRIQRSEEIRSTSLWEKLYLGWEFHWRTPRPLASKSRPTLPKKPLAFVLKELDLLQTENLQQEARRQSMTVNEWLIASLAYSLSRWNMEHEPKDPRARIRIMVPTSLRGSRELRMPAANRLGFGFVSLAESLGKDLTISRQQAILQTRAIGKFQLGLDFVEQFSFALRWPMVTRRLMRLPRCLSTAVFTSLGDLSNRLSSTFGDEQQSLRAGDLKLQAVYCTPPIRPLTRIGIGTCIASNRLTLSAITDLDPQVASDLLDLVVEEVISPE